MVLDSIEDGTTGFVSMETVAEAALTGVMEDLAEIAGQLLWLHVEGTEALDARCVDEVAAARQAYHLREGGSMRACVMGIADLCSLQISSRHQAVDERGLPHSTVATKQSDFISQQGTEFLDALARGCRYLSALVADGLVETYHELLVAQLVGIELVGLVEHQYDRYAIGLGRSQETVDEGSGSLWPLYGDDEKSLVDVGRNDMALLGEVDALADNVVATVVDVGNPTFGINSHTVAYGYGIGAPDAFDTEITLDLTIKELAIVGKDGVPAPCILYNKSFQISIINSQISNLNSQF